MGLLTGLLGLPLAQLRGTVAIGEQVLRQAEETYYDPAIIRRQLETVAHLHEEGALSDAEAAWWEEELLQRLIEGAEREGP
ncbi:gas vesicle protein GvpG [Nocardioides sp. TF02-7]|uniref:gas vesicle protein GvpG n=1 Tax=Nocardioides sp. TF02-7 TaxID=2917724 RepID=UPI001F064A68|nr:gas vesicle protein GvpG [Nocardioides sp. TF02-7]UMG94343.1 gas vesicle protein GvpG [Nocardioides sp. TF02-7]